MSQRASLTAAALASAALITALEKSARQSQPEATTRMTVALGSHGLARS